MTRYIFFIIFTCATITLQSQIRYGRLTYVAVDSANNEWPYPKAENWGDTIVVVENGEYVTKAINEHNMREFHEQGRDSFTLLFGPKHQISFSNMETDLVRFFDIKAKKSFNYRRKGTALEKVTSFEMSADGVVSNYEVNKASGMKLKGLDAFQISYDYQEKSGLAQVKAYVANQILLAGNAALQHPIQRRFCPIFLEITYDGVPKRKIVYRLVDYERLPRKSIKRYVSEIKLNKWDFGQ